MDGGEEANGRERQVQLFIRDEFTIQVAVRKLRPRQPV